MTSRHHQRVSGSFREHADGFSTARVGCDHEWCVQWCVVRDIITSKRERGKKAAVAVIGDQCVVVRSEESGARKTYCSSHQSGSFWARVKISDTVCECLRGGI